MTTAPGLPETPTGLTERAVLAARAFRASDPDGFHHRTDSPGQWSRWSRRARVARTIAAALQVGVDSVLVTDDPRRTYRTRTGPVPGDLITITDPAPIDPAPGRAWRFIPDLTTPGDTWLFLDCCPSCDAEVPVIRIATLADLGEYLDPEGDSTITDDARDHTLHQSGCMLAFHE